MNTWPDLLAHLKHLRQLVTKHKGTKRKELERRIGELQVQASNMSSRDLRRAEHQIDK
jgi:hypothetical protein